MKKLFAPFVMLLSLFLFSSRGYAYPEMIREGYASCGACHYSPSGGGQINQYGRSIAGDTLSTWGTPQAAETFFGAFNIAPLDLQANSRYLYHHYKDDQVEINQRFFMEKSVSLTWNPAENVSLLMSGGLYGPDPKKVEYRTYFGVVHMGPAWVRVGRFLPSFGYEIDDHTKAIKEFLGQGKETVNAEVGYAHKYFEVTLARVFGEQPNLSLGDAPAVQQVADWNGYTGKVNFFLARGVQVGVSEALTDDGTKKSHITSYHAFAGYHKIYSLMEYQVFAPDDKRGYFMAGFEIFKGFHIRTEVDKTETKTETFGTIRWWPYPHMDLQLTGSNIQQMAVIHFYL